jgi:hypothetical protein
MDQPAIQSALPPAPADLEQPSNPQPKQLKPHAFTPESARAASVKSVATRKHKAELRRQILNPAINAQTDDLFLTQQRLKILNSQITRTHKLLSDPKSDISHKDRAQLLNALDRLIERERILRGIPAPQNTRENIRTLQVKVQPIISPQPAPRAVEAPSLPNVQDVPDLPEPNP